MDQGTALATEVAAARRVLDGLDAYDPRAVACATCVDAVDLQDALEDARHRLARLRSMLAAADVPPSRQYAV